MRKISKHINASGFTLVEMMIALGIFVLVLGIGFAFFNSEVKGWQRIREQIEIQENLRIGMDRMVREVRQASKIGVPPFNASTTLSFFDSCGNHITYYFDPSSKQLIRSIYCINNVGSNTNPMAGGIESVNFEVNGERAFVKITLQAKGKDEKLYTLQSSVCLRVAAD